MSGWQSIFALGACEVAILGLPGGGNPYAQLWKGALRFGQSSPVVASPSNGNFQVTVDAVGNVTLLTDSGAATQGQQTGIEVYPQTGISTLATQSANLAGYGSGTAYDDTFYNSGGDNVSLTFAGTSVPPPAVATPSVASFAAHVPVAGQPALLGLTAFGT